MAKEVFDEADEAFFDDRYKEAYELYTNALTIDDQKNRPFTSKIFSSRAECALKMKKNTEALEDSNRAIELDDTNIKAYLRKGIALYRLEEKEEASKIFECGLLIDEKNDQLRVWQEKCQKELIERRTTESSVPSAIVYSYQQSDETVTVVIPIKGLKQEEVQVNTTDTTLRLSVQRLSTDNNYTLELNLPHPIDASRTAFAVNDSNIEIQLRKREPIPWASLDTPLAHSRES